MNQNLDSQAGAFSFNADQPSAKAKATAGSHWAGVTNSQQDEAVRWQYRVDSFTDSISVSRTAR
ncbi:MAG: hypothetical protein ACOYLN_01220, partial [Blastocatellia bacterium]